MHHDPHIHFLTDRRSRPGIAVLHALAWLLLITPVSQAAEPPRVEFVYAGHRFSVPAGFAALGAAGNEANFVAFRYGDQPGKQYLAFSDLSEESAEKYGCDAASFLASAFGNSVVGSCRANDIATFREHMLAGHARGSWKGRDSRVHYLQQDRKTFLFFLGANGRVLQIDSDFLDRAAMKQVLAGYVD